MSVRVDKIGIGSSILPIQLILLSPFANNAYSMTFQKIPPISDTSDPSIVMESWVINPVVSLVFFIESTLMINKSVV